MNNVSDYKDCKDGQHLWIYEAALIQYDWNTKTRSIVMIKRCLQCLIMSHHNHLDVTDMTEAEIVLEMEAIKDIGIDINYLPF